MYSIHTQLSEQLVGCSITTIERELILATLKATDGNRTHAARILDISIRTLRNKISQYAAEGVDVPEPGAETAGEASSGKTQKPRDPAMIGIPILKAG